MATVQRNLKKNSEISRRLLHDLKQNLVMREVSSGIALLEAHEHLFASLDPEQSNAAAFVGCVAQWVDIGYGEPGLIEQLLARLPKEKRGRLRLIVSATGTEGSLLMHQDAQVYAGLFDGDENAVLEVAPGRKIYVHVARGRIEANGTTLGAGDALKVTDATRLTLGRGVLAEVLVFDLPAT